MTQKTNDPLKEDERPVSDVGQAASKEPELDDIRGAKSTQVRP